VVYGWSMTPRAAIKVDFGTGVRLGPGKVELLERVEQAGSIAAAARCMNMSYRRAWLLVDEINGIFGQPVVETVTGGSGGGGARITEFGKRVVTSFRDLEQEVDALVKARMAKLK